MELEEHKKLIQYIDNFEHIADELVLTTYKTNLDKNSIISIQSNEFKNLTNSKQQKIKKYLKEWLISHNDYFYDSNVHKNIYIRVLKGTGEIETSFGKVKLNFDGLAALLVSIAG